MRQSVVKAKELENAAIAQVLGHLAASALLQQDRHWRPDVVAQVPTHWWKRAIRRHCSAEVMAATISKRLRRPNVLLLESNRWTEKQGTLSAADRKHNVSGAFSVAGHYPLHGKRVLLVDDVLTTGATASSATKALLKAGAAEVRVAVAARGTGSHFA
jgi:predicted amidophosphoribosyltransferase